MQAQDAGNVPLPPGQADALPEPLPAWLTHDALALNVPLGPSPPQPAQNSNAWLASSSPCGKALQDWLSVLQFEADTVALHAGASLPPISCPRRCDDESAGLPTTALASGGSPDIFAGCVDILSEVLCLPLRLYANDQMQLRACNAST